jgi:putative membrane protein
MKNNVLARFFTKTIASTLAILFAAYILRGIEVKDQLTALIVALVLGLLNSFIKPVLVLLTIPITVVTLGLFLFVINIVIVKWTASLVPGFTVDGWVSALFFSLLVSFVASLIEAILGKGGDEQAA